MKALYRFGFMVGMNAALILLLINSAFASNNEVDKIAQKKAMIQALSKAAKSGNVSGVTAILADKNCDKSIVNGRFEGLTPLMWAIKRTWTGAVTGGGENRDAETGRNLRTIQVCNLLISHCADTNLTDEDGRTPLALCCLDLWGPATTRLTRSLDLIKIMLEHDGEVNSVDKWGMAPLMFAARSGQPEVITALLEKKADINLQDYNGHSALMWAFLELPSHFIDLDIITILLSRGADVHFKTSKDETALAIAERRALEGKNKKAQKLFEQIADLLRQHGA